MSVFAEKPTLYIVARRHDLLEKYRDHLRIRNSETKEIRQSLPALSIRDIVVVGDILFSGDVFKLCEKFRIPVHFIGGNGDFRASILFDFSKNVFVRKQQFLWENDPERKLAIAQLFVRAKVHNQNKVLQRMRVTERISFPDKEPATLDELRGIEGSLARAYFQLWKGDGVLKNTSFPFIGRRKNPATDPINSLLSFCYTLFYKEIHTQLLIAGMDPYVGYLHEQTYGHAALASDFIEIFRGVIDQFVLRVINRGEFDVEEDFVTETGGVVKLSTSGFQKFFPKWSHFLRSEPLHGDASLTKVLERDVRLFVRYLMGDEPEFIPFYWKR